MRKKILVILSRVPYPLEKGDKLRAFHQLRELSKYHDLILCALSDGKLHPDAREALGAFTCELHVFHLNKLAIAFRLLKASLSSKPFQVAYFFDSGVKRKIRSLLRKHRPDHLYCQLIRTAEYAKGLDIHKTLDYQDAFSAGLLRRLDSAAWYMKALLRTEYHRVRLYEAEVFHGFDEKTIISRPDRDMIEHPGRDAIHVIPNGVDTGFFKPMEVDKEFDVVFTGNMAYPPNVNAAEYLVKKVMPIVWKVSPGARVVLAGATPTAAVRALSGKRVRVTGWVEDIRTYYAQSRVFVAPMLIGCGLQNKLLEAMAMGLPCISSPLANSAVNAREGVEILIGRSASEYAEHMLSLLKNEACRRELGKKGHAFVCRNYDWEKTSMKLESLMTS